MRALILLLVGLSLLGCERNPPAAAPAPCNCDAARGGTPHQASGRTEIIR